ncbi:MAG: ERCC4 domain-containing protein [Candidatus Aenigmatarchaeota archaeon]
MVVMQSVDKVIIYADSREMNSKVTKILAKRCTLKEEQLCVGDYILSNNVCVERKTTSDFLQSMIDGRLFSQLSQMKKEFKNPLLVIEGDTLFNNDRKINHNAVRGALSSIAIDMSLPIIWTKNQLETAEMLCAIAKREQTPKKKAIRIRTKRKPKSMNQMQEFLVSGIPLISYEKARNLLKHFGSPDKIFAASEAELQNVEGIGKILAKKIKKILTAGYEKSILE